MDTLKLHIWDILTVVAYLIICLVIGLYRATKIKTPRQFALGYRNVSTTLLVCILFASNTGAGTLFGYTEKLYLFGLIFLIARLFVPLCYLIAAQIYAPNIEQFKDCISVSHIMYKLYGSFGRWITNIASIIIGVGLLTAQALALGYAFNYFFGIKIIYGILISYGVLTVYTVLGGIRAIVLTETFQFGIFFFIIPVSYVITIMDIGGMPSLMQELPTLYQEIEFTVGNILLLGSLIFSYMLPESDAPFIQRCLMAKDGVQLKKALKTVCLISIPFTFSLCLIVYIVKAHSPEIPGNEVILFYISNYLPIGLKALMFTGIIAAIMSLAEAWLNATGIIIANDIVKVLFPKMGDRKQLMALRVSIIILSVISVIVASFSSNILGMLYLVRNFWAPLILVPLASGFLEFRTSNISFIISVILALFFTLIGRIIAGEFATISVSLGILGSTLGLFGTHYWETIRTSSQKGNTVLAVDNKKKHQQILKIKNVIAGVFSNLINAFITQVKSMLSQKNLPYQKFATFTLIYYFVYTFSLTSDPIHRTLAYLLIIGYLMCFILFFLGVISSQSLQKRYLPIYFYCIITFCLPTVSSYMLFSSRGDDFWIINGLLSTFSLYFFVDALTFVILFTIGGIAGYGLFLLNYSVHIMLDTHNTLGNVGYIYLFFLFAYLMLFRGREKEHDEKIGQMHMLSGAIAHEVKTPIASMIMSNQVINEILGKTIKKSKKNTRNEYIIKVDQNEYDFLMQAQQSVQTAGAQSINTINSILTSLKNSVIGDEKKLHLIEECIKQAIEDYSLFNNSAKDIEINIKHNFQVMCSLYYLTHVFINLLKNAYKHGGEGEDVKIKIWTKESNLYFKDYGKGISKEKLPYIFDRFYTGNKTGTGIGLAFCNMVMKDLGGDIECESKYGKYTTFILKFPKSNG